MNSMPHDSMPDETGTLDRRGQDRDAAEAQVSIHVDTSSFGGLTKNVSQAGVFFFSSDQLRVTVQIDDDSGTRTATGNLVRVERVDGETTGFAIEFDH